MSDHVWYAARVASGRIGKSPEFREIRFKEAMRELGLPTLVPCYLADEVHRNERMEVVCPLYSGYAFIGPRHFQDWQAVKRERLFIGLARIGGEFLTLNRRALNDVRMASQPVRLPQENAPGLKPGDRIAIRKGQYAELDAVINSIDGNRVTYTTVLPILGQRRTGTMPLSELAQHHPGS